MRIFVIFSAMIWVGVNPSWSFGAKMSLEGQVSALADDIRTALKENPLVKGQKLTLGQIVGEARKAANSNSGLEIERQLRMELAGELADDSNFVLAGSYVSAPAELPENNGLEVLVITLQIKKRGRELLAVTREVNQTDDIFRVLGLTGAAPQKLEATAKERNDALKEAADKPSFATITTHPHRVASPGLLDWSLGVLKKSSATGTPSPVIPEDDDGHAFVPLAPGDYYEIELTNGASHDVVASVTVDGLNIANAFSIDKDANGRPVRWPGYLIPGGQTVVIRGWLHTVAPTTNRDNLLSFLVAELGQGAASALKARGSEGVITAQFRESCAPSESLERSFGETAAGEGLEEKLSPVAVKIGENVLSTVSIRYNQSQ